MTEPSPLSPEGSGCSAVSGSAPQVPAKGPTCPSSPEKHPNITCDPGSADVSNRKWTPVLLRAAPSGGALPWPSPCFGTPEGGALEPLNLARRAVGLPGTTSCVQLCAPSTGPDLARVRCSDPSCGAGARTGSSI